MIGRGRRGDRRRLGAAAGTATAIPQLAAETGLDVDAAYARAGRAARSAAWTAGERLVGLKMGLTSKAKMAQVGVDEVIWGRLTDAMRVPDGGTVDAGRVHPPAGRAGGGVPAGPAARAGRAVGDFARVLAVAPAIELIDSRYADFQFTLPDVIADNTSAAAFVIGPWQSPVPARCWTTSACCWRSTGGWRRSARPRRSSATRAGRSTRASGWPARHGLRLPSRLGLPGRGATAAVPLTAGAVRGSVRAGRRGLGVTASLRAAAVTGPDVVGREGRAARGFPHVRSPAGSSSSPAPQPPAGQHLRRRRGRTSSARPTSTSGRRPGRSSRTSATCCARSAPTWPTWSRSPRTWST